MKLNELLSKLDTKVPIVILENSPSEHPNELQHTEVIYDSNDICHYTEFHKLLVKLLFNNYIVTNITCYDGSYSFTIKIYVVLE